MAVDKNKITAEATKLVQKGQWDKAIKAYERILAEEPKDVRILLKVGELHQKKGRSSAAAEAFNRVAEAYEEQGFFLKAVAVYKQVVKLAPDDLRVNQQLAALYRQLGLMSDAMAQMQLVAAGYEKAGDSVRLLDVLKRMVELDPDNIASRVKLGELYAKAGHAGPALEQLRRAAEYLKWNNRGDDYLKVAERIAFLAPEDMGLTRELAHMYLAKGDTKRALAKLQLCFKANPKNIDTLSLLAQAFRDLGQLSKTASVLREIARVHEEESRAAEARATYRQILEIAPDDPDALAALSPEGGGAPSRARLAPPALPAGQPMATSRPPAVACAHSATVPTRSAPATPGTPLAASDDVATGEAILIESDEDLVIDETAVRDVAAPALPPRPAPGGARPSRTAVASNPGLEHEVDLSDEIAEAGFYVQQGLYEDAREQLSNLLAHYPGHRAVQAKLAELARTSPAVQPRNAGELAAPAPADESFDIAWELAQELGPGGGASAPEEQFQYSVEDVFNQFKKGVEKTVRPEDTQTHYDLGIAYKEMGLLDDAIHEFEVALLGRKKDVDCLGMIGICRAMKGETREAVEIFQRALASQQLGPDAAKALQYELGAAHEALGNVDAALQCFRSIANVDPRYRDVPSRIERLGGRAGRRSSERHPPRAAPRAGANGVASNSTAAVPAGPQAGGPAGRKKNIGFL